MQPAVPIAVLEVGGTHASSRWIGPGWQAGPELGRVDLDAAAGAEQILVALATCVAALGDLAGRTLAVALPGPFDYEAGVGRYHDVGKYEALNGVDVRSGLFARLDHRPARIAFLNDAQAFGLGEWVSGNTRQPARLIAITLGTGVGSAFIADGAAITRGEHVPPGGELHRTQIEGRSLEDVVSRRAILARYRGSTGAVDVDVAQIAAAAGAGDPRAVDAFVGPLRMLGEVLAGWVPRFEAELVVVGGAVSRSWDLVEPALRAGLGTTGTELALYRSHDPEASAAIGAAWHAQRLGAC